VKQMTSRVILIMCGMCVFFSSVFIFSQKNMCGKGQVEHGKKRCGCKERLDGDQ
jgi:hypothetical protein